MSVRGKECAVSQFSIDQIKYLLSHTTTRGESAFTHGFFRISTSGALDTIKLINFFEEQITRRVIDEEARKIIKKYSKCENATEFQALDLKSRDKYLRKFKEKGISIRQISRLTGVSYYIVQKI